MRFNSFPWRVLLIPLVIITLLLSIEGGFRFWYFGLPGLNPKVYTPRAITLTSAVEAQNDKLLPFRLRSGCKIHFKGAAFSTNKQGWRSPMVTLQKPTGVKRIAILGASVVMGAGVADEEVFSVQLQQRLNQYKADKYEVLNFSVGGYRLGQFIALYPRYAQAFDVDALMLPLYYNGYLSLDDKSSEQYPPLSNWFPRWDNLRSYLKNNLFIYQALRRSTRMILHERLALDWAQRGRVPHTDKRENNQQVLRRFFQQYKDIPIYILALHRIREMPVEQQATILLRLQEFVAEFPNVHLIDTVHVLRDKITPQHAIYWGDNHPNAQVHAWYAQVIADQLSKHDGF